VRGCDEAARGKGKGAGTHKLERALPGGLGLVLVVERPETEPDADARVGPAGGVEREDVLEGFEGRVVRALGVQNARLGVGMRLGLRAQAGRGVRTLPMSAMRFVGLSASTASKDLMASSSERLASWWMAARRQHTHKHMRGRTRDAPRVSMSSSLVAWSPPSSDRILSHWLR
jgi:hypothetical protein